MKSAAGLTPRQERFCREYLIDLNGKQAAIRTGYSPKTAEVQASHLLSIPKVKRYVGSLQAKHSAKAEITVERVLREYEKLAFADPRRLFDKAGKVMPIHDIDDHTAAAIAAIQFDGPDVRVKMADKKAALDSIARHLGMFIDRHSLTDPEGRALPAGTLAYILCNADPE